MDYIAEVTIDIPDDEIKDYVKDTFLAEDVYDKEHLVEYISGNYSPDDVFTVKELAEWAERNGYVKEE